MKKAEGKTGVRIHTCELHHPWHAVHQVLQLSPCSVADKVCLERQARFPPSKSTAARAQS